MTTLAIPYPVRRDRRAFTWLLVGFAMTLIDFRVNRGPDLVPDCVGYLAMMLAALSLRRLDRAFAVAAACAAVMTPFSVVSLFRPGGTTHKTGNIWLDSLWGIGDLGIQWAVCTGVIGAGEQAGRSEMAARDRTRRTWIVTTGALFAGSPLLACRSRGCRSRSLPRWYSPTRPP
jgi:hypothetical protein